MNSIQTTVDNLIVLKERKRNLESRYLSDYLPSIQEQLIKIEAEITWTILEIQNLDLQYQAMNLLLDGLQEKAIRLLRNRVK